MNIIKKLKGKSFGDVLSRIESIVSAPRVRLLKTFYVNFRCLPFKQAVNFPITIRGKFNIHTLGKIVIDTKCIRRGMIKFGGFNNKSARPTRIVNNGTIIFHGYVAIWEGVLLELGNESVLELGNDVLLGENVNIMLRRGCKIGNYARIAFDSQIMDSDFHYMLNLENSEIKDCTIPVTIGNYNWIGNRTTIKKGTITPDYTIVAAPNALLSKDYRMGGVECPILGGCPAKVIGSGRRRIYSHEWERLLYLYFKDNTEPYIYRDNGINPFAIPK